MTQLSPAQHFGSKAKALFVALPSAQISDLLGDATDDFEIAQSNGTADTIALVIRNEFKYVVVDQSKENIALSLLVPLLAGSEQTFKLIVICQRKDVGSYLRIRGVDRVLPVPVAQQQLRLAMGVGKTVAKPAPEVDEETERPVISPPNIVLQLRSRAIALVSTFYKNAAFVLLAILFVSFCFYGLLIGYFLVSSSWGAPVTLSNGHELVARVEQQINELKVNANLASQHKSEAELEAAKATRDQEDARLLVGFVLGTVEQEIDTRTTRLATLKNTEKQLARLLKAFGKQLSGNGMSDNLARLYKKRLIDRKTLSAETLGLMDAGQKLSNLEINLANLHDEALTFDANIKMLKALRIQLEGGEMQSIAAATSDLILLTKQAVDARSAYDQAKTQVKSANDRKILLGNNQALLENRIHELQNSALGRAIGSRIDVIFVPYGNEAKFTQGSPLYTCTFTIVMCHRAGTVGAAVPGESNSVHPFFGKPIRGYFVEAILTDKNAASQEIIHAGRPPFFF